MRLATIVALLLLIPATTALAGGPLCAPGYYSPNGEEPCYPCEVGEYSDTFGALSCQPCEAGKFANTTGSEQCQDCPAGTYAPTLGSAECTVCPDGSIAPSPGSQVCEPCPPGTTSDESHTECVTTPTPREPSTWGMLKSRYGKAAANHVAPEILARVVTSL